MTGKVFFLRLKRKTCALLYKPIKNIYAIVFLRKVINMKTPNMVVITLASQLGDSIYGIAFIGALKRKCPNKHIVVIGQKKYENILKTYSDIDKLILINNRKQYKYIDAYIRAPYISHMGLKHDIIPTVPLFYKNVFKEKNTDTLYQLRKVYGVSDNAPISYHKLKPLNINAIPNYEKAKDRIAILNPYSTALFRANMELFEILCTVLNNLGYIVYTNVVGTQKEVFGSKRLSCSLEELYSIASEIPVIVSVRSGILDYLVPSGINIFAIYDNCFERWIKMFNINSWNGTGKVKEIYLPKRKDYYDIADELNSFIKKI